MDMGRIKKLRQYCSTFSIVILLTWMSVGQQLKQKAQTNTSSLCLDGFCIGESINDSRFDAVDWLTPEKFYGKDACKGVGCSPQVAFRGYPASDQQALAEAVSLDVRR